MLQEPCGMGMMCYRNNKKEKNYTRKWPSNNNGIVLQEQYDTGMMCYRSYVAQSYKNGLAITMALCYKNNVTQV